MAQMRPYSSLPWATACGLRSSGLAAADGGWAGAAGLGLATDAPTAAAGAAAFAADGGGTFETPQPASTQQHSTTTSWLGADRLGEHDVTSSICMHLVGTRRMTASLGPRAHAV